MKVIRDWLNGCLADPQVVLLALLLLIGSLVILTLGQMLAPVFAGLIIAYLLEGVVALMETRGVSRRLAVPVVFVVFMVTVLVGLVVLVPLLIQQIGQLVNQLPSMLARGQEEILALLKRYPSILTEIQVTEVVNVLRHEMMSMGQATLAWTLSSVRSAITFLIYLILVPLLVFFFLKDKDRIRLWLKELFPAHLGLTSRVWQEVNLQIGNYIHGRVLEILIVWAVCYVTFIIFELQFAMLLSLLIGLSVLIPYIGALVVSIPVVLVAYYQWTTDPDFVYVMVAYLVILALDANVLCPILLSEVVDLHPVAIIVAILVFGGLWGFWGVFFAIPLAILIQAVLKSLHGRSCMPAA